MLLSLSWLREFVPYEGTAQELGDRLTMLGLELEEIVRPYDAIAPIVVGHVVECVDHPESDHLHICKVDAGQGELLEDRKSTRLNSSHTDSSRMPSSA